MDIRPTYKQARRWYDRGMKLLVLESRGHWAAALRRKLPGNAPPFCETRAIAECDAELTSHPTSFVVAELTRSGAGQIIEQLASWHRRRPLSALAIVASSDLASWREVVLEAGAILVAFSPRELADLVAAIRRHAARHPQPPGNAAERIWAELPLRDS